MTGRHKVDGGMHASMQRASTKEAQIASLYDRFCEWQACFCSSCCQALAAFERCLERLLLLKLSWRSGGTHMII